MTWRVIQGDCREVMADMDPDSVDAVVTDPPYGLHFMGKSWDQFEGAIEAGKYDPRRDDEYERFMQAVMVECLRVLRPGGHVVAFGSPKRYHRLVCAVEDAGFEIRDTIMWLYGSGFPKSHNVAEGIGTALKPAHEPIVLARKPLDGTVADNLEAHGVGALNIDGCRVPSEGGRAREGEASQETRYTKKGGTNIAALPGPRGGDPAGRWPANVIHDGSDEVVEALPEAQGQAGAVKGDEPSTPARNVYGTYQRAPASQPRPDRGSAARFFYCAKAARADREAGLDGFNEHPLHWSSGDSNPGAFQAEGTHKAARNNHPTVKPTDLMRYLVRLVTPYGGTVLDPFVGSGSTGRGGVLEGRDFVGIELDEHYCAIARARIQEAVDNPHQVRQSPVEREVAARQQPLFDGEAT